jgi:predicted GNAT family acetyltransferase
LEIAGAAARLGFTKANTASKEIPLSDITIRHNAERERFEILDAGRVIGKAVYKEYDGGESPQRIFYHTVVNEEYGGQGLAGRLATVALDETVAAGIAIVPVCPFIKKFLTKHPEYAGNVAAVKPAHLEFLDAALSAARSRA